MEKSTESKAVIKQLIELLQGRNAHKSFTEAIEGLPAKLRGVVPDNLPYSIWQLVCHIHVVQWDVLEFSKDSKHKSPEWPKGYWIKEKEPESETQWDKTLAQIENDKNEFLSLLKHNNIYAPFLHGDGQNLLREALLIADHTAYHTAEIILIRRLLGDWK